MWALELDYWGSRVSALPFNHLWDLKQVTYLMDLTFLICKIVTVPSSKFTGLNELGYKVIIMMQEIFVFNERETNAEIITAFY